MISYNEARAIAISEAARLNIENGFKRWHCVSMDSQGRWYADECLPEELTQSTYCDHWRAPFGFDLTLNIPLCEQPQCFWKESVAGVN